VGRARGDPADQALRGVLLERRPWLAGHARATVAAVGMSVAEPVLVIGFNRPDHLSTLLDTLRGVQPQRLFIAIDGPREGRPDEAARVAECRGLVSTIDWSCEIRTQFQEHNLGCGRGVSTAITWFLSEAGRGIILEDDIIPDPSFFPYCSELLDRYEDDPRVLAISGCNFVPPDFQSDPAAAYRFSQVPHIWGWATWRRAWQSHRLDIAGWERELPPWRLFRRSGNSVGGALYWASIFELLARGEVDTWDGQLVFSAMRDGALTATSNVNLIRNIGFDELATHTLEDRDELPPTEPIRLPTTPVPVAVDERADAWTRRHHFGATTLGMLHQASRYLRKRQGRS
jgi:hypothetical protein